MIDLFPRSILDKFGPGSSFESSRRRDWGTELSEEGLLSPHPDRSPRRRHALRRDHSLSRFLTRKACCSVAALVLISLVLLSWSVPLSRSPPRVPQVGHDEGTDRPTQKQTDKESAGAKDGAHEDVIPIGTSVDRGGREVFWWEQFPRLHGLYQGRKTIVPFARYVPEQASAGAHPALGDSAAHDEAPLGPVPTPTPASSDLDMCYIDSVVRLPPPAISAYQGLPQGMSAPLFGSQKELGLNDQVCYDRINRFAPYGLGFDTAQGGLGVETTGDNEGVDRVAPTDWRQLQWHRAQQDCVQRNADKLRSRSAFVIRTWHTFKYNKYHIMMLRAIISELALTSRGQYTVHFLIHVQDDSLPIWASQDVYDQVLRESLPEEFYGMGTLWSVAQMKLIYPPPFPESVVNFSGGDIYEAYRSLHFPMQYFAYHNPAYDYFWHWEMDLRVTGHYLELLHQISTWAERQPRPYAWERSAQFFIPSLYDGSYDKYAQAVQADAAAFNRTPVAGPQLPQSRRLEVPPQQTPAGVEEITDLITFNPLFDPTHTRWAFHDDITGYNVDADGRPPTRASLITASRMSRRLLVLMHQETYRKKHTMFPEMFPASIALHYGLKAVHAPIPVYFDRDWPSRHANEIFNNAPVSAESKAAGMDHGNGHFHGDQGSVFGPGEHVFRSSSYYSNAAFAGYLWRRWLGRENAHDEVAWEAEGGAGGGRMCLPMMVVHPVKDE